MKKLFSVSLIAMLFVAVALTSAHAQSSLPSAKATASCGSIVAIPASSSTTPDTGWQTILSQQIKTSSQKDLFIDVSLETGLTTNTTVASKLLGKSAASANAMVQVQVLLDGNKVVSPGVITFDQRRQTMIAQFAGYTAPACYTIDPVTHAVSIDEDCVQAETLELILETMAAHSFNFIASNVNTGVHTIEVQAKLSYDTDVPVQYASDIVYPGQAAATAYLGKGAVTIESVRMVNGQVAEF